MTRNEKDHTVPVTCVTKGMGVSKSRGEGGAHIYTEGEGEGEEPRYDIHIGVRLSGWSIEWAKEKMRGYAGKPQTRWRAGCGA